MTEDPVLLSAPLAVEPPLVSVDVLALVADSVICTDEDGYVILFNRAAEQSFGYTAGEVIGHHVDILLPQRYRAEHANQVQDFASTIGTADRLMGHQREVLGLRKNGEEFPAEASISRHLVNGRTILTVVHRDITDRKELEAQREAITQELDHRIQNVLSVVSSLVSLSAKSAASVDEFKHSLLERVRGLAATQAFLRRSTGGTFCLRKLLLAELAHYQRTDGANVVIKGDTIALRSAAVQPLALVFHELATNSAKYGSFSDERGRVTVTFEVVGDGDERLLAIEWCETGGPPVERPSRSGFGTTLIEQVIRRAFQAEANLDYRPEGLVCQMKLPIAKLEDGLEA